MSERDEAGVSGSGGPRAAGRRVLACYHAMIPSTVIRLRRPLEAWARQFGGEVRLAPEHLTSDRDVLWADAVVLSRGATFFSERVLKMARRWSRPVVSDLDDHLLAISPDSESAGFYGRTSTRRRMRRILRESDLTVLSTAPLRDAVGPLCRDTAVIPNAAPTLGVADRRWSPTGLATALLAASDRLEVDFLLAGLQGALETCPGLTVLCIGSALPAFEHPRFRRLPVMPHEAYLEWISEELIDFAIVPMPRSPFHDCKSNIKFLDFAAAGIPGVYSRGPVFEECVGDGRGLLVENTAEGWRDAIAWAAGHPREMREMAGAAKAAVQAEFGVARAAEQWDAVIRSLPRPTRAAAIRRSDGELRVLVFAPEPISENFTGPNLRAIAMARELAQDFDATLATPNATDLLGHEPFAVDTWRRRSAAELIRRFHVVISTGLQYPASDMIRAETVQVFDLYDPILFEILAGEATMHLGNGRHLGFLRRLTRLMLLCGDHFLCASERQRDLWLGALYIAGRFGSSGASLCASPSELVGVVPFGHGGFDAASHRHALKGVHLGIAADDKLILWGGGIWNWLDPLTLVRAVAELQGERSDVKLYFLGMRASESANHDHGQGERAVDLARDLGVLDRAVFFNRGWTPLGTRADILAEADLAVCTAPDTAENHFASRTRLVDAIGAGVPILCTRGCALAEYVEENEIGLTAAPGDVRDLAEKIQEALRPERQRVFRRNLELCRDEMRWDACVEPLRAFCRGVARGEHPRVAPPAVTRWSWYLRYKVPTLIDAALGR